MPVPTVKDGKWSKERDRTKSGRWRKKRSDANRPKKRSSRLKYVLAAAAIGIIILALIVVYLYFHDLLKLPGF